MTGPTGFELLTLATPYALHAVSAVERADIEQRAAAVFVYRFAPETKGRQLEDLRHFRKTRDTRRLAQTTAAADATSSLTQPSRFMAECHGGG
jgi:predicted secreted protein